jgi:hypothetical protein
VHFLLQDIGISVDLPIVVKTDKIGALFMSQNSSTGVRTRHVDTRYHFIRENQEDGIIMEIPLTTIPIFLRKMSIKRFTKNK